MVAAYCAVVELDEEVKEELSPERALAASIISRAMQDILGTNGKLLHHEIRDAKAWLFDTENYLYSAEWWADVADLEPLLERCRNLAKEKLNGKRIILRNRPGRLWGVGRHWKRSAVEGL